MQTNSSCLITLSFLPAERSGESQFRYELTSASEWNIGENGDIHPPSPKRLIRIQSADPNATALMGLQLALRHEELPKNKTDSKNFFNNTGGQVIAWLEGADLLIDADEQEPGQLIWYRLGILHAGEPRWDDPRIYNPPDEAIAERIAAA